MTTAAFATVVAAVPTPFHEDLGVDFDRLARHAHWLLENGCEGLVLFGTTGEAASLSLVERKAILERLVDTGVPAHALLVGTGCCAIPDTVELMVHAAAAGTAGALVLPPYFFRSPCEVGLAKYYGAVIGACGRGVPPIYLYNIPQITGAPITLELVARLLDSHGDTIRGYKDSSGAWDNTTSVSARFPDLHVFVASEARLLDHLSAGGTGCISASINVQPARVRRLVDSRDTDAAGALQPVVAACRSALEVDGRLIPNVKVALAELHGDAGWLSLRPPLELPPADARSRLRESLRAFTNGS